MLRSILFFSMTLVALAQTPTVTRVVNSRSGLQLSPGALATVVGTGFGADFIEGTGTPLNVSVSVGGKQASVILVVVGGTQVDVQIPVDAPTGAVPLTVSVGGVTSAPFNITLDQYAPTLAGGSDIVPTGIAVTPYSPAKPGDTVGTYASGLGPSTPPTPTGPAVSANPTAVKPALTVGGVAANVLSANIVPGAGAEGNYLVKFIVPAGLQGTQSMILSIGGRNSAPQNLSIFGISAIVSNASFASAGTAAPSSIASLFGNGVGSKSQTTGFPGTTFQGVSVIVNGIPAPLFHLSVTANQNQIDFLMPTELPSLGTVNVQLVTPSGTSLNYPLTMVPAVPAFYRIPDPVSKGRSNIIAQFANTSWLALPAATATALKLLGNCQLSMADPLAACAEPAAPGDYLVIYITGLGKTTPNGDPNGTPLATGAIPPPDGSVLYKTVAMPVVTVGGVPATILYSGLAPGFPGEYQVDIQVPAGVTPGDDVPVTITMPGSITDTVTISVQPRA